MDIKIKKLHPEAIIPIYAKPGDAGLDLVAISFDYDSSTDTYTYYTGLSIEIPEGYVGLLFPRSSIFKYDLTLSNSVGCIDSGYRGEIMCKFTSTNSTNTNKHGFNLYKKLDRIIQLIILPYPKINLVEVKELNETNRGSGGFGHTGN